MRTWLLITLQRYGGWKEYLGNEKGMAILSPFKMECYKKALLLMIEKQGLLYCINIISRGWVYIRMSFYIFIFILFEETF